MGKSSKHTGKVGKHRLKSVKAKRWKKGHSSDSNPQIKTHREASKNRNWFGNQSGQGEGGLTIDALAKHDEVTIADIDDALGQEQDAQTVGGRTFSTWATNWTDCTNTTFNKVHRMWNSNSALHKEVLAILAAVTEVIKTNGGKESETEYYAALITTLDTLDGNDSLAAAAYLLSLCIKRVPVNVLKKTFSESAKCLLDILAKHGDSSSTALLKPVLQCLAHLLRVQEAAAWNSSSTLQVYHGLLAFTIHVKPKVRKSAQQAVNVVLKGSFLLTQGEAPPHHPAASVTAKYCIQQIEQCGGGANSVSTLHTLELLKDVMSCFPQQSLKSTCETVLRLTTLSNKMVTAVAMRALHGMFLGVPKPSALPAQLNAQIITALYDLQPGDNDGQPMNAWLSVMDRAHVNLSRVDKKLAVSHLPRFFTIAMKCLLSERPEVRTLAAKLLVTQLKEVIEPQASVLGEAISSIPAGASHPIQKMFAAVEAGLSYQYHATWIQVLNILSTFYEIMGQYGYSFMKKCLVSLADLRGSHQFAHRTELDKAVGAAVQSMGPRQVLEVVPLQITGEDDDYDFPRSWLLPVLRDKICNTELNYFTCTMLPLAAKLRNKAMEFSRDGKQIEFRTYDTIQQQIWSLLPGFCTKPTDLVQSFKSIAKILGTAISERPDLRMTVMASIRKLIQHNLENELNKAELRKFAKNFLPILFNQYTTDAEKERDPTRMAVLETMKCYLQVAPPELIATLFDKCYLKLDETDISTFRRHALFDLTMAMVPYVDKKYLATLFTIICKHLKSTDRTVQKKSYRILEELCSSKSEACKTFVSENLGMLQSALLKSLSSSSPSSKAPRLRCLIHIFKQLQAEQQDFLVAVVPEAILCTREVGEKPRAAAYGLLVEMGETFLRWKEPNLEDAVGQYLQVLMAGLAGNPQMVTSTVLALTKVVIHFRDKISSNVLETTIESACILLTSKAREIVSATLGLLRVLLAIFDTATMAQFLKKLMSSLVSMKDDNRHHFRFIAKKIFSKLVKKFGYETIHSMVPESHEKMMRNIRKIEERSKKQQRQKDADSDDSDNDELLALAKKAKPQSIAELLATLDSDLEDDAKDSKDDKAKKSKTKKSGSAWILEQKDEEIVDFLDPAAIKKVVGTKPVGKSASKETKDVFKMSSDGRLIITADGDEEEKSNRKNKRKQDDDMDDLSELMDAMDHYSKKSRKKKKVPTATLR